MLAVDCSHKNVRDLLKTDKQTSLHSRRSDVGLRSKHNDFFFFFLNDLISRTGNATDWTLLSRRGSREQTDGFDLETGTRRPIFFAVDPKSDCGKNNNPNTFERGTR